MWINPSSNDEGYRLVMLQKDDIYMIGNQRRA